MDWRRPPSIELNDDSSDEELEASIALETWVSDVWRPWSERRTLTEKCRCFYKELYSLRVRLENERDAFELVWGFGRLQWVTDLGTIDHPLITVPVEIELDAGGILAIAPSGPAAIESACLSGVELADPGGYASLRQSDAAEDIDLWSDSRPDLLQRLLRFVDHEGRFAAAPMASVPGSQAASLSDEWVFYLRRRQPDYLGFLERQRELLRQGVLPPIPFVALVDPEPAALEPLTGVDRPDGEHTDLTEDGAILYLPKPANEQQRRLLEQAQRRSGVTVQGPPGTGKTHTIANLICHFVAEGQRVLVTAEKEQALREVTGALPPSVRELTVAILGSDALARNRMEHAINAIHEKVTTYNSRAIAPEIARLTTSISSIDNEIANSRNALRATRAAETEHLTGIYEAGVDPSPSEIAAWLADTQQTLSFVGDPLTLGVPVPLSATEWNELLALLRTVEATDVAECRLDRPRPAELLTGEELRSRHDELEVLRTDLSGVEDLVADWDKADGIGWDVLEATRRDFADAVEWRQKVAGSWLDRVRLECTEQLSLAEWSEFRDALLVEREAAIVARRATAAHHVVIPTAPPGEFVDGLREAEERFRAKKGVGILQRQAAKALAVCTVDQHRPRDADEVSLCLAAHARWEHQRRLATRWAKQMARIGGPELGESTPEDSVTDFLDALGAAISWSSERWPGLMARLGNAGIRINPETSIDDLGELVDRLRVVSKRQRERVLTNEAETYEGWLNVGRDRPSGLWERLRLAYRARRWDTWDSVCDEVRRLASIEEHTYRLTALADQLASKAPGFADALVCFSGGVAADYETLERAWQWRQLEVWLKDSTDGPTVSQLSDHLTSLAQSRLTVMEQLVAALALRGLKDGFTDRKRQALDKYLHAVKRFGKTGGKFKERWTRQQREALDEAKDAVPALIMPTGRALESFRPEPQPPFDVIIVDEASQIGLLGLPILGLARKAIVVGDDQQISPQNIGLNQAAVFELINTHIGSVSNAQVVFDPQNSLYDVSRQKFPEVITLLEHFRCLPPIIAFSNDRYYGGRMDPLRDMAPRANWQPTGTVFVPDGYRDQRDVNESEARAVVELIEELFDDSDYEGMSFGVIGLIGTNQAKQIRDLLLDRLGPDVIEDRKLRCGTSAEFQGAERDVMVLSTVVDGSRQVGSFTSRDSERILNVAASRACNQLWVVHSIEAEDFPGGDPREALIRHCVNPASIEVAYENLEQHCESEFEKAVARKILGRGFHKVRAQYATGGYRIDLVVEGRGGRLAVECDGDAWHGPDQWDSDRIRQEKLERAGWPFERITGSGFYRDPDRALEPLWQKLEDLEIRPTELRENDEQVGKETQYRRIARTMVERRKDAALSSYEVARGISDNAGGDAVRADATMRTELWVGDESDHRPSAQELRDWARQQRLAVGTRGRLAPNLIARWNAAHPNRTYVG